MYSFDFQSKLKKLNDRLFIASDRATATGEDFVASGIYVWKHQNFKKSDYSQLADKGAREWLEAAESGMKPEFVCAVPQGWVPEYDIFDIEGSGRVIARGWRSILLSLNKKNLIDLRKARLIFDCHGLGLEPYDHLDTNTKVRWSRGERYVPQTKKELF